jgi:hypothetical protein
VTWPVRSKQLVFYVASPAANTVVELATVPTGKTWLVKDWSAYNGGSSTRDLYLIQKTAGGVVLIWDQTLALASGRIQGNSTRHLVLPAGDKLAFQSSTNQALQLQISGAQLG